MKLLDKVFNKLGNILYPEEEDLILPPNALDSAISADASTQKFVKPTYPPIASARSNHAYFNGQDEEGKWWNYPGVPGADNTPQSPCDIFTTENIIASLDEQLKAGEIPVFTVSSSVMEALNILNKKDFEYGEVAAVMEKNPTLTGMFLSSINSSFYNRGYAITELRSALSRLGKNNIRALLQLYSVKISFTDDPLFGKLASQIIKHSYLTGVVAAYLSQRYYPEPGLAFLAGLLHDVGKLGILKSISQQPRFIVRMKNNLDESMFAAIFDQRHEQVGTLLAQSWSLDRTTMAAIAHHHHVWGCSFEEDDQLDYQLCMLTNLSDTITRILGYGRPIGKINIFLEQAAAELNIEKNAAAIEFLEQLPEIIEYKAASNVF